MPEQEKQKRLWNVGLGAGLLGAVLLALRYAVRRPTSTPVPDTISPKIFTTKVLHTSRFPIVYHESGSGQPLIFVHSICLGGSSYEWSKVYPEFAATHRVMALDLIGFGESARPNVQLGAADYVRILAEFIKATCRDTPPVLIGSGLGAGFCIYLASQHPEMVSRLILLTPTGLNNFGKKKLPLSSRMISRVPMLNRFVYRNYLATKSAVQAWLMKFAFVNPELVTTETVDVFTTCAQQYGAEYSILNLQSGLLNFDLEKRVKMLTLPVTLLWGSQSMYPSLESAYWFQGTIKNCSLVLLQNGGVLATLESPQEVVDALRNELQGELRVYKTS